MQFSVNIAVCETLTSCFAMGPFEFSMYFLLTAWDLLVYFIEHGSSVSFRWLKFASLCVVRLHKSLYSLARTLFFFLTSRTFSVFS